MDCLLALFERLTRSSNERDVGSELQTRCHDLPSLMSSYETHLLLVDFVALLLYRCCSWGFVVRGESLRLEVLMLLQRDKRTPTGQSLCV